MHAITRRTCPLVVALVLILAPRAQARWTQNGTIVGSLGGSYDVLAVATPAGGLDLLGAVNVAVYDNLAVASALDAQGNLLGGAWGSSFLTSNTFMLTGALVNGTGSNVLAAVERLDFDLDTFAQLRTPIVQAFDGTGAALWGTDGLAPFPGVTQSSDGTAGCSDGAGGIVVVTTRADSLAGGFTVFAQRVLADSSRAWALQGVAVSTPGVAWNVAPAVARDATGGFIVVWAQIGGSGAEIQAQRLSSTGVPQWAAGGVSVMDGGVVAPVLFVASDGAGGSDVVVQQSQSGDFVRGQRLTAGGAAVWTAGGVDLVSSGPVRAALDADANGVAVAWVDLGGTHSQRFSPATGAPLVAATTITSAAAASLRTIVAPDGGAFVAWASNGTPPNDVRVQRIAAAGGILWNDGGIVAATYPTGAALMLGLVGNASGGVDLVWAGGSIQPPVAVMRVDGKGNLAMLIGALTSAADIPNDQGGALALQYAAPYTDAGPELPEITGYNVWRLVPGTSPATAAPPASLADAQAALARSLQGRVRLTPAQATRLRFPPGTWESLGFTAAVLDSQYRFVVPTLNDSGPASSADETYLVTAHTASPSVFGVSNTATGHSRDNLAPASPANLHGAFASGQVVLGWSANTEPDLAAYAIFRGASGSFTPGPSNQLGTSSSPAFTDPTFVPGAWYKLEAIDRHGNASGPASLAPTQITGAAGEATPHVSQLRPPVPNPARGGCTVAFGLAAAGPVRLVLLDVAGRVVRTLASGEQPAGAYALPWDGRDDRGVRAKAGLYFVRLEAPGLRVTRKLAVTD